MDYFMYHQIVALKLLVIFIFIIIIIIIVIIIIIIKSYLTFYFSIFIKFYYKFGKFI
jgi:hypothetical protein